MSRLRLVSWLCVACWLGMPLSRVGASTILAMSMNELAAQADVIVHGVVVRKQAKRVGGRIVTDCTLQVEQVAWGDVTVGQKVTVRLLGGEIGEVGMRVVGEPECGEVGDRVVIAASGTPESLRPLGMSQGWFAVQNGLVQPSGEGLQRITPSSASSSSGSAALRQSEAIMSGPEDVHSFMDRFRELAKAGHARATSTAASAGTPSSSVTTPQSTKPVKSKKPAKSNRSTKRPVTTP
jgi:hypothetical protein